MNIAKLKEGQVFRNYRVMCEELEMEIKTSNSKKAQIKELERFCSIQKVGHSLTIIEVYEKPKETIDSRGKSTVYGELMQLLISDFLIENKRTTTLITRNNLLKNIHVINNNYTYGSRNVAQLSEFMNIDSRVIYDFYNTSSSNFKSAFETALKNLRSQALIIYNTVTVVCSFSKGHNIATEEEKEYILSVELEVLEELEFEDITKVRVSSKWNTFKQKVSRILHSTSDIEYYYTSYQITSNENNLQRKHNEKLLLISDKIRRKEVKNELNTLICERLLINAENRKSIKEGKMAKVRGSFSYLGDNKRLVATLIDSNARDITREIENIKNK